MQLVKSEPQNMRHLGALAFIGLGVMLLLGIDKLWPLLIMLPGIPFMYAYYHGGRNAAPMAIPGALILGTGGLLLFQSITGYWESWAYAWTLYGVFFGVGLTMMGERLQDKSLITIGRGFTFFSGIAFAGLGFLFILLTSGMFRIILMLAFFAAGAYLLFGRNEHQPAPTYKPKKRSDSVVEDNIRSVRVEVDRDEEIA